MEVILITGTMGSGKTTTLGEVSDMLRLSNVTHAAVDLDALGLAYVADAASHDLMMQNLAAVCENFTAAGIGRLLIAAAVESRVELARISQAVRAPRITVCRLTATVETMEKRVAQREVGVCSPEYVARVRHLNEMLDDAALEHFCIDTDSTSVSDVARRLLLRAGWA